MTRTTGGDKPKSKRKSTNAPGAYLGFSFQTSRVLMRLLQAGAGDVVCLEVFDDVGVEHADGTRTAEQAKSNRTYNSLSDRALDLWKTLDNWGKAITAGELDVDATHFEIYTARAAGGAIASSFRDASTAEEAARALEAAYLILHPPSPKNGKMPLGGTIEPYVNSFFDMDRRITTKLIARFNYQSGSGSSIAELKAAIMCKFVSEDVCEEILNWAIGWINREIDALLEQGKPARIHEKAFRETCTNHLRTYDRLDLLRSVAGTPKVSSLEPEHDLLTYVRQLRLIEVDDEDVLAAVNDYLRASTDRTFWAAKGLIDEDSLGTYSEELCRSWRNKKARTSIQHSERSEADRGKLLYLDCMENALPLDGLSTQPHFARGSCHSLAEDRLIGWHPRYDEELQSPKGQIDPSPRVES